MATKVKAQSTQLKEALEKIIKLEEELKRSKSYQEALNRIVEDLRKELESIHGAIDIIDGAPDRFKVNPENQYDKKEISVAARLFSWLANKN